MFPSGDCLHGTFQATSAGAGGTLRILGGASGAQAATLQPGSSPTTANRLSPAGGGGLASAAVQRSTAMYGLGFFCFVVVG